MNLCQMMHLHSALRVKKTDVAARLGTTYLRYGRLLSSGEFKPEELVSMCNMFRVPMGYLVSTNSTDGDVVRNDIQVDRDLWTNISYKPWRLQERADKEKLGVSDIARATGKSRVAIRKWMTGETTIVNLMLICSRLGWNLGYFISDPTLPQISGESDVNVEINNNLIKENAMLRREIADLRTQLDSIKQTKTLLMAAETDGEYNEKQKRG